MTVREMMQLCLKTLEMFIQFKEHLHLGACRQTFFRSTGGAAFCDGIPGSHSQTWIRSVVSSETFTGIPLGNECFHGRRTSKMWEKSKEIERWIQFLERSDFRSEIDGSAFQWPVHSQAEFRATQQCSFLHNVSSSCTRVQKIGRKSWSFNSASQDGSVERSLPFPITQINKFASDIGEGSDSIERNWCPLLDRYWFKQWRNWFTEASLKRARAPMVKTSHQVNVCWSRNLCHRWGTILSLLTFPGSRLTE
jgi:hypothetical protein